MGLTSLHDFYGSWHLCICRSLFGHTTFFCRFARVHEGQLMCNKEEFQVELSRKIVLWPIFIGHRSAWFPLLLSACRLVEFDTAVMYQWNRSFNIPPPSPRAYPGHLTPFPAPGGGNFIILVFPVAGHLITTQWWWGIWSLASILCHVFRWLHLGW